MKKRHNPNNHNIIARGPEIIPREGTRAWYEYANGRRFYEPVLPGQRFPEGANQRQLDALAIERRNELARAAAVQAITESVVIEEPAPVVVVAA